MKKTRIKGIQKINEGAYDFYEIYDPSEEKIQDKIINYYLDKINKDGQDSLTEKEMELFKNAQKGIRLNLETPIYKRNKVTNEIEYDPKGNPIRLDKEAPIPGIPFVTSKGKGNKKKQTVNARCYWNVDEDHKMFYVYGGEATDDNPNGLVIWKSYSVGKEYGAFIVPKGEVNLMPEELWANRNNVFDKGIILDPDTYKKFLEFDKLYHISRKMNAERLNQLYRELRNYSPGK
jgi:hypothetical protein